MTKEQNLLFEAINFIPDPQEKKVFLCRKRIKLNVLMMPKFHMRLKALFKTKKLKIYDQV